MECWVVAYDIPDDKRRNKIARILEDFGDRVQFSVFEVMLEKDDFGLLRERINKTINPQEDSVRLYRVCEACAGKTIALGIAAKPWDRPDFIVI